jgi:predicted RNase H-like HicB family nuclease
MAIDTNVLNYRVIIEKDSYSDGRPSYMASCPTLGVVDYGDTVEQALANIREAIGLIIKNFFPGLVSLVVST